MRYVHPSPLLGSVLAIDAVASGALALLQTTAAGPVAAITGLPSTLVQATGVFLAGYVVLLLVLARAARVPAALIALVVAGNVGWALGCLALLTGTTIEPHAAGVAFVALHAAGVLVFAALEYFGLRRSTPAPASVSLPSGSRTQ